MSRLNVSECAPSHVKSAIEAEQLARVVDIEVGRFVEESGIGRLVPVTGFAVLAETSQFLDVVPDKYQRHGRLAPEGAGRASGPWPNREFHAGPSGRRKAGNNRPCTDFRP